MLERQGLILAPWQERAEPDMDKAPGRRGPALPRTHSRPILDRDTRQLLGVVRVKRARVWSFFRWLIRQTWEVLETDDESLLISLLGPWGLFRQWEIIDAEDRLVCTISSGQIIDSAGHLRARRASFTEPLRQGFVTIGNEELAWCRRVQGGIELVFLPVIQDDPYIKMSLLAAALVAGEEQRSQ
jgi:hypothetical protein